jgi:hypothetical protein
MGYSGSKMSFECGDMLHETYKLVGKILSHGCSFVFEQKLGFFKYV